MSTFDNKRATGNDRAFSDHILADDARREMKLTRMKINLPDGSSFTAEGTIETPWPPQPRTIAKADDLKAVSIAAGFIIEEVNAVMVRFLARAAVAKALESWRLSFRKAEIRYRKKHGKNPPGSNRTSRLRKKRLKALLSIWAEGFTEGGFTEGGYIHPPTPGEGVIPPPVDSRQ